MKTVLFVNKNISDYDKFVSAVKTQIELKSDFNLDNNLSNIKRIGLVWHNCNNEIPFGLTRTNYKYFTQEFLNYLSEYKNKITVDLITCSLDSAEFKNELAQIKNILPNVTFAYSKTPIGNGSQGNWILESSGEDMSQIYFTSQIKNYSHVLGFPTSIPNFTRSDSVTTRTFTLNYNITIGSGTGEISWTQQDITYSSSGSTQQLIIDGNGYTITINQAGFDGMFISGYTSGTSIPTILQNFNIVSNVDIKCALTVITGSTQFSNCKLYLYGNISNNGGGICYNDGSGSLPSTSGINTQLSNCTTVVFGKIGNNAGPLIGYINLNSGNIYNLENCSSVVADNDSLSGTNTLGSGAGAFVGSGISNTVTISTSYCIFNGSMANGSGIIGGKFLGSNGTLTFNKFYAVTSITRTPQTGPSADNSAYILSSYYGGSPFTSSNLNTTLSYVNILNIDFNLENIYGTGPTSNTIYTNSDSSVSGIGTFIYYSYFFLVANTSDARIGPSTYTITYSGSANTFYSFNTNPIISWVYDLVANPNTLKGVSQLSSFTISNQTYGVGPFIPSLPSILVGNATTIIYSSSNTNVATIDPFSGLITILAGGNVIMTATLSETDQYTQTTQTAPFTINKATSILSSWSIPNQTYSLIPFTPTLPTIITGNGSITYSSSNNSISTINNLSGLITLISGGFVTMTATLSQTNQYAQATQTASFTINITPNIKTSNIITTTKQNERVLIKLQAVIPTYLQGKTTFIITTQPSNGTVRLVNNVVLYSPNLNYVGTDSFQYQCVSEFSKSNISTVNIVITPNVPDIRIKDINSPTKYLVINLDHLQDYYGSEFKISIIKKPSEGKLLLTKNKIIYEPNNKSTSKDKFYMQISTSKEQSNVFAIKIKNLTVS